MEEDKGPSVSDIRALYLQSSRGALLVDQGPWEKRAFVNTPANQSTRVAGAGVLGGVLVLAGAATTTVRVYDQDGTVTAVINDRLASIVRTATWDGIADFPINMQLGIVFQVDQADATVIFFFR